MNLETCTPCPRSILNRLSLFTFALFSLSMAGCTKSEPQPEEGTKTSAEAEEAQKSAELEEQPAANAAPAAVAAPSDVAAAPADAVKTASGLASKVLSPATKAEEKPQAHDEVTVHYTGWTTDGKMFDSSAKTGRPATFVLNQVIAGWTEGLQLMAVGEKRRLWIPEALAYKGQQGRPSGMLVFDVELLSVRRLPAPPKAPEDLKKPGKGAKKTKSGLVSRVIKKGTGKKHPAASNRVKVHYTGWTQSDGKMFDSSIPRERPAEFGLGQVIPGWTEGVQLMVEGEQRRFWIPGNLAYDGRRGPQGTLVFDVELLEISTGAPAPSVHGKP